MQTAKYNLTVKSVNFANQILNLRESWHCYLGTKELLEFQKLESQDLAEIPINKSPPTFSFNLTS